MPKTSLKQVSTHACTSAKDSQRLHIPPANRSIRRRASLGFLARPRARLGWMAGDCAVTSCVQLIRRQKFRPWNSTWLYWCGNEDEEIQQYSNYPFWWGHCASYPSLSLTAIKKRYSVLVLWNLYIFFWYDQIYIWSSVLWNMLLHNWFYHFSFYSWDASENDPMKSTLNHHEMEPKKSPPGLVFVCLLGRFWAWRNIDINAHYQAEKQAI